MDFLTSLDLPTILQWVGTVSSVAFIAVALGDFVVLALDKIATSTVNEWDNKAAAFIAKWWAIIKELWDTFREVIDKVSAFSRPKK